MAAIPSTSAVMQTSEDDDVQMTTVEASLEPLILSPVETAFHIDIVLKNVAENLDFSNLKKFRLVNKTANAVAYSIMLSKDLSVVKFKFDYKLKTFVTSQHRYCEDLVKLIEKSGKFPCSSFSFVNGDLGCAELQRLFNILGHQIKTLTIIPKCWNHFPLVPGDRKIPRSVIYTKQQYLADLLQRQLPKVETLHIGSFAYKWKNKDKTTAKEHRLTLSALKCLFCIDDCNYNYEDQDNVAGLEMLASAPNLKAVYGFNERYYDLLVSANQIDTVKGYTFRYKRKNLDNLIQFSHSHPMLESLDFYFNCDTGSSHYIQVSAALNRILESSQNSLNSMRLNIRALYGVVEFQIFHSLKHLTLDLVDRRWYLNFYIWQHNSMKANTSCFRNVESVSLFYQPCSGAEECDGDDCAHDNVPEFIGNFPMANTLKLYHPCIEPSFHSYRKFFPNVKKMIIETNMYSILSEIVRSFRTLEEIEFNGLDLELDEFFVEQFSNAITKAKSLKKMKLLYDTNSDSTRYSHKIGTLSKEIIENGINLMPELQVTLAYDHYSAVASEVAASLKSILPHPRICVVHEEYESTPFDYDGV